MTGQTSAPCGCCPYCGALPGHQNPPAGEVWRHQHSPVREPMRDSHVHRWERWDSFGDYGWTCIRCGAATDQDPS